MAFPLSPSLPSPVKTRDRTRSVPRPAAFRPEIRLVPLFSGMQPRPSRWKPSSRIFPATVNHAKGNRIRWRYSPRFFILLSRCNYPSLSVYSDFTAWNSSRTERRTYGNVMIELNVPRSQGLRAIVPVSRIRGATIRFPSLPLAYQFPSPRIIDKRQLPVVNTP